jgi:hypothetical protein
MAEKLSEYLKTAEAAEFLGVSQNCKHRSESAAPFAGRNVQRS